MMMLVPLLDDDVPVGEFLDEQIARVRQHDIVESDEELETENTKTLTRTSPRRYELPKVPESYTMSEEATRDILACKDRDDLEKLLCKYKERSLNAKMKCDLEFATSPILIDDKDYELSVDLEVITLVESDPFHGYETETVVAHLTKSNDIGTLFSHDEKIRYYYILRLFPFSLKADAKAWYNTLAPGCVRSPQDMIYYFSKNISLLIRNKLPCRNDLTLCKLKKRDSHKLVGCFSNCLILCLIILLRKMKYLISSIMD